MESRSCDPALRCAAEAEATVNRARRPYPEYLGDGKYRVAGRGVGDRFIQVIYLMDSDGTAFIIHARPLSDTEKRRMRRRIK